MVKKIICFLLVVGFFTGGNLFSDDFEIGEDYFDDPADKVDSVEKVDQVDETEKPVEKIEKPAEKVEKVNKVETPVDKVEKVEEKKAWWCAGTCDMTRKKNEADHLYIYRWDEGKAGLWLT
ncbi:MAG TPA: hypothetical protein VLJ60_03310, partial [bacterium]|nr:hypothetical protein [bacterium]